MGLPQGYMLSTFFLALKKPWTYQKTLFDLYCNFFMVHLYFWLNLLDYIQLPPPHPFFL